MSRTVELHDPVREPFTGELIEPAYEQRREVHNRLLGMPARSGSGPSRPNSAPAYYLGRPARLWIKGMSPRRRRLAIEHLTDAIAMASNGHNPAVATPSPGQ